MTCCPVCHRDPHKGAHGYGHCTASVQSIRLSVTDLLRAFSAERPSWPAFESGCSAVRPLPRST